MSFTLEINYTPLLFFESSVLLQWAIIILLNEAYCQYKNSTFVRFKK